MKLIIKNMVCPRCIMVVTNVLSEHQITASSVLLGEVELKDEPTELQIKGLQVSLIKYGFEVLNEPNKQFVEQVKNLIINKVQHGKIERHFCLSTYLKSQTFKDYSTITKTFSAVEGCTIEKFFILQKMEKAKELLFYGELPVNLIADRLGYSSSQHLSVQFKKFTSVSPKDFKKFGAIGRKPLDAVAPEVRYTKNP